MSETTIKYTHKLRTGTTAQWAASSRILKLGEPGFDSDLKIYKMGDGVNLWSELDPVNLGVHQQGVVVPRTFTVGAANSGVDSFWGSGAYVEYFIYTAPRTGVLYFDGVAAGLAAANADPATSTLWYNDFEGYVWAGDVEADVENGTVGASVGYFGSGDYAGGFFLGAEFWVDGQVPISVTEGNVLTFGVVTYDPVLSAGQIVDLGSLAAYLAVAPDEGQPLPLTDGTTVLRTVDGQDVIQRGYMAPGRGFAAGGAAEALGIDSVAFGNSLASGELSTAEGNGTASGPYSHSEAISHASGERSHAEGSGTASGYNSHAENNGQALGDSSHAEGSSTASGSSSHAEGVSEASGVWSHSQGLGTESSGPASHASGYFVESSGDGAFAHGIDNSVLGLNETRPAFGRGGKYSWKTELFSNLATTVDAVAKFRGFNGSFKLESNRHAKIRMEVVGSNTTQTVSACWDIDAMIARNNAGTYRVVGTPTSTKTFADAGAAAWTATFGVDATGFYVTLSGSGGMRWTVVATLIEAVLP